MLTLEKGVLTIKATDLTIRSFLEAYQQDTSKDKQEATKLFWYVHLASQIDAEAPFFRAATYEIQGLAKREVYKDELYEWKDSIYNPLQVAELIKEYKAAYTTPEQQILKEYDNKIYEAQVLSSKTKIKIQENTNEKTGTTTYSTNYNIIEKILIGADKLIEARDKLVAKIRKEGDKGAVRGQQTPSYLEQKHEE